MSMLGLFDGSSTWLVGVEDDPEGGVRCYLGHRASGVYCVIEDPDAIQEVRRAWGRGGHVVVPTPPNECLYRDLSPASDEEVRP